MARTGWSRPSLPAVAFTPDRRPSTSATLSCVSTVGDYYRFVRMLADGGRVNGEPVISADHLRHLTSDQVAADCKTPDSFFPGFWDGSGWGFGLGVTTARDHSRAATAGPADKAPTSSSIATGRSAFC